MIVVDSSALISIIKQEEDAHKFQVALSQAERLLIGAPTKLEILMVAGGVNGQAGMDTAQDMLTGLMAEIVPWTNELADIAAEAFLRFGKGKHPAKLNFGDCMAYALAKSLDAPLLFKGGDFALTDVKRAI